MEQTWSMGEWGTYALMLAQGPQDSGNKIERPILNGHLINTETKIQHFEDVLHLG